MYARINYTCTKNVNSKLSNPGYSLTKVVDPAPIFRYLGVKQNQPDDVSIDSGVSDCSNSSNDLCDRLSPDVPELLPNAESEVESETEYSWRDKGDLPLNSRWSMYTVSPNGSDWDEKLVKIGTFETVKGFWSFYHHLKLPTYLKQGIDYYCFRRDIQPRWEDGENANGGLWIIEIDKYYRNDFLDSVWLETLLGLIGECMGEGVNGAAVQSRKGKDKVTVWVADAMNVDQVQAVHHYIKQWLNGKCTIRFKKHFH